MLENVGGKLDEIRWSRRALRRGIRRVDYCSFFSERSALFALLCRLFDAGIIAVECAGSSEEEHSVGILVVREERSVFGESFDDFALQEKPAAPHSKVRVEVGQRRIFEEDVVEFAGIESVGLRGLRRVSRVRSRGEAVVSDGEESDVSAEKVVVLLETNAKGFS